MKTLKNSELRNKKHILTTEMFKKNNNKIRQLMNSKVEDFVFTEVEMTFWNRISPLFILTLDATYDL